MTCGDSHLGLIRYVLSRQFNLVDFPFDEVLIHGWHEWNVDGMVEFGMNHRRI